MRRGLLVAVVGVIVLVGLLAGFQRRLIYFPDQAVPPPPAGVEEVTAATRDGLTLAGWLTRDRRDQPLLLVFHGNAGTRAHRLPLAAALREHDIAVLLTDYRGYGGNPGNPTEAGLALDAAAWRAWAEANHNGPVSYYGESLGTAVATSLAVEAPPAALILRSPFTSLAELGSVHYPLLPVRWLLLDRFDLRATIGAVDAPLLVVVGAADEIIPVAQSRAIYDAAASPKRWVEVAGARHNDLALLAGSELVAAVAEVLAD